MNDKFVNFEGKEYTKFPILSGAIIYDEEEYDILIDLQKELIRNHYKSFKLISEEYNLSDFLNKNREEIKNIIQNNQIYIFISKTIYKYYYKYDQNFYYLEKKGNNFSSSIYEKLLKIIEIK